MAVNTSCKNIWVQETQTIPTGMSRSLARKKQPSKTSRSSRAKLTLRLRLPKNLTKSQLSSVSAAQQPTTETWECSVQARCRLHSNKHHLPLKLVKSAALSIPTPVSTSFSDMLEFVRYLLESIISSSRYKISLLQILS